MEKESKAPYTREEKEYLCQLIKKYPVLESKKTDAGSITEKHKAWEEIASYYNTNFNFRSRKQLRKLWDNLKQRTRKSDSDYKYKLLKTGGGTPPKEDNDPISDMVRRAVPTINMEVENWFDSDALPTSRAGGILQEIKELPEDIFEVLPEKTQKMERAEKTKKHDKVGLGNTVKDEGLLRVEKLKRAIEQQEELHEVKMACVRAEKKYWEKKTKRLT